MTPLCAAGFGFWDGLRHAEWWQAGLAIFAVAAVLINVVAVFVAVALHALHGIAALLWLVYVTLRGFAGDYDHEYRFGLTACGWCWHALGVVWIAILFTFATAR